MIDRPVAEEVAGGQAGVSRTDDNRGNPLDRSAPPRLMNVSGLSAASRLS
jgi:hypothetical protein